MAILSARSPAQAQDIDALRPYALELVNKARAAHSLKPLVLSEPLNAAAQAHAADMLPHHYFDHTSSQGGTLGDRLKVAGFSTWRSYAENIAMCRGCAGVLSRRTVAEQQQGWMNSPGHRANILTPDLDRFGFGLAAAGGALYAVQTFTGGDRTARPQAKSKPKLPRRKPAPFTHS
jgi:uncharacterized protein YkwD